MRVQVPGAPQQYGPNSELVLGQQWEQGSARPSGWNSPNYWPASPAIALESFAFPSLSSARIVVTEPWPFDMAS